MAVEGNDDKVIEMRLPRHCRVDLGGQYWFYERKDKAVID
jgi:hypothetical protein